MTINDMSVVGIEDVARELGQKKGTIYRWSSQKQLPPPDFKIGNSPAWYWVTIREWAKENMTMTLKSKHD